MRFRRAVTGIFCACVLRVVAASAEVDPTDHGIHAGRTVVGREILNGGVTKPFIIVRELHQEIGAPFSVQLLLEDLQRLENLGIFSNVTVTIAERPDGIVLQYRITEMPWIVPYPAFRYNEENGWSVGLALSSLNLTGRNIGLAGRVLFGGTTTFEARLTWPWITGDHVSLDMTANRLVRQDEILEFEERSNEITPWVGTYLGKHGRLAGTASWFRMNADKDGRTLSPSNRDDLFRLGLRVGWDSRDSWRDPHSGWQNEIEILKSGGWLGGQGDYLQTTFDVRRFIAVQRRHTVYLGGLTTLSTGTVGTDFPPYFLFRLGGANTIRGYDVKELGRRLYGKNQMITTAEYQVDVVSLRAFRILRWSVSLGLQAAVFADLGVAWSGSGEFAWNRFRSGYGGGLRLLIPGSEVIRFDLGVSQDGDVKFHIGPWFRWTAQRQRLR